MTPHTAAAAPIDPAAGTLKKSKRHMPGEEGIWVFVFGDMMVFSLFFITFLYYRGQAVELFAAAQTHLNQAFGALNTFLMLTSSWFVALGVHAARRNLGRVTPICLMLALACGFGFVVVKVFEYSEKFRAGITINSNDFFMYYFMFTGIHLLHVLIGTGVLLFLTRQSWAGTFSQTQIRNLESGASFWHLVDLLWIVLFPLLYVMR